MPTRSPLETEIRRRIAADGPMPVAEYMALCLAHPRYGYYITRDPLGVRGDFITAPEVSQMFGELIGLWMAAVWRQMGSPQPVRVVELGPGRGTLISDALRAAKAMPSFREVISAHLVETSPVLRARQEETLRESGVPMAWHPDLTDVPSGPAIVVANEFFDALPVSQAVKCKDGWRERRVGIGVDDRLIFTAAPNPLPGFGRPLPARLHDAAEGAIVEWRDNGVARALGRRIAQGGAALVIDYGHARTEVGDTLQAVGAHAYADPLTRPGELDLTAHVDFERLMADVQAMGVAGFGPIEQGEFLRRLGIDARAAKLKANAATPANIDAALARLTGSGRDEMGRVFKVVAFAHPALSAPPGFD